MKKGILTLLGVSAALALVFSAIGGGESANTTDPAEKTEGVEVEEVEEVEEKVLLEFLDGLIEYGYTEAQIEDMRTLLVNVGIVEITNPEIGNLSYGMQTIKGVAYRESAQEVQVKFTIENGVIFLVNIYCPSYHYEGYPTYLDGLEDRRANLYYDLDGGYLKKIDWENKVVIDY